MDDEQVLARIKDLVDQEHALRERLASGAIAAEDEQAQLARVETSLDQAWDLLRQRRARREFGDDPDRASQRPADEVENYRN